MSIFKKVLEIYKEKYICYHCLGRMFSLLATNTTNEERGASLLLSLTMENHNLFLSDIKKQRQIGRENLILLANNAQYLPAKLVLESEAIKGKDSSNSKSQCFLCQGIFNNLEKYIDPVLKVVSNYEFDNFLVGTSPEAKIVNREDILKAKLNITEAESFKSHFNREMGKILSKEFQKPTEFLYPDITIIFRLGYEKFSIDLLIRSIFIYGRYKKLIRGIPQTKWICTNCNGKGCEECDNTGKRYQTSVEELISPEFINASKASDSKFHGAGREDIDVRMLGSGRPFVLELINPEIRSIDLQKIKKEVNRQNKGKVDILELSFSDKDEVIRIKEESEDTQKTYRAIVSSENEISRDLFEKRLQELKDCFKQNTINQQTPHRVLHRRTDKFRKKKIFKITGQYLEPTLYEFIITSQGGTYIKELITGDNGRTSPSFSEIFAFPMKCEKLDVQNIDY